MRMPAVTRRRATALVGAGALVTAACGVAFAVTPVSTGVITACYAKNTGALRILAKGKKCNAKTEKSVTWNGTGPKGATGTQGVQGVQGLQGLQGPAGPSVALEARHDGGGTSVSQTNYGASAVIIQLTIPTAGAYSVSARTNVFSTASAGLVDCQIVDGTAAPATAAAHSSHSEIFTGTGTTDIGQSLQWVHTFAAGSIATLQCIKEVSATAVGTNGTSLIATLLGAGTSTDV